METISVNSGPDNLKRQVKYTRCEIRDDWLVRRPTVRPLSNSWYIYEVRCDGGHFRMFLGNG